MADITSILSAVSKAQATSDKITSAASKVSNATEKGGKLAARFRAKGKDPFNIGLVDALEVADSSVRSLKQSVEDNFTAPVQGLMTAGMAKVDSLKASVLENDTVRRAKSAYGFAKLVTGYSNSDITKKITDLLPSNIPGSTKSKLSQVAASCMTKGASWEGLGKPYDTEMTCNSGKKTKTATDSCNATAYNDVLNSLSGNTYKAAYADLNKTLKGIVALSKIGYDMNLCGVLGALISSETVGTKNLSVIGRAAAAVIAGVAGSGKVSATIDAVKSLPTTVNPALEIPALAAISTENYQTPEGMATADIAAHGEAYVDTLTILDGYAEVPSTKADVTKLKSNTALVSTLLTTAKAAAHTDASSVESVGATPQANLALLMMVKNPAFALTA